MSIVVYQGVTMYQVLSTLLWMVWLGLWACLWWRSHRLGQRIEKGIADYDAALNNWEAGIEQRLSHIEKQLAAFHKRNDAILDVLDGRLGVSTRTEQPPAGGS